MKIRNLTAKSDKEFLGESVSAMLAAYQQQNVPLFVYWAQHAWSFAQHKFNAGGEF